jgi:ADP-heptose:LPS heptosyltransferase
MRLGTYRLRRRILGWVTARSGWLARAARYPNPLRAPWRRAVLDIVNDGGIGDVVMCTPGLRELKRRNPRCRVRFYSKFSSLVRGLPYIDEALPYDDRPTPAVYMVYIDAIPPRARIISLLGDRLGVRVTNERLDCVIDPALLAHYQGQWAALPYPRVTVLRRASRWTPNKDWPDANWTDLIGRLSRRATVIEIGEAAAAAAEHRYPNYIDLRGRTSVDELAAVVAAADLHVGPISGPVHIAAAASRRAVVIYGGYEDPAYSAYQGNVALYTPVSCAPCWLRDPCPYERKCLAAISVATVEDAVWSLWQKPPSAGQA